MLLLLLLRPCARRITVMSSCLLLLLMMTSLQCQAQDIVTEGPASDDDGACCASRLVDSSRGRVVLETSRALDDAVYSGVRLRLCTLDTVGVQLWRRVDATAGTYRLRWQTVITPTESQITASYVTITLSERVNVTFSDRVGLYTASGAHSELSVPFERDQTAAVYYSRQLIATSSQLVVGQTSLSLSDTKWHRSFRAAVVFCLTPNCSELIKDQRTSENRPRPGHAPCCQPESGLSCDPSPGVTQGLTSQRSHMQSMRNAVNQLNEMLSSLVSQNYVTGLCPQGFLSGSYGVGSCYLIFTNAVAMAQAVLTCRSYGALLLTIETPAEQQFIKNFVQNNTIPGDSSVIEFWTTGMYNVNEASWYWYAGTSSQLTTLPGSTTTKQIVYSHWWNDTAPTPATVNDVCLTVAVDRLRAVDYWTNALCYRKLATICEIPKRCL